MEKYTTKKGENRFRDKIWINGDLIRSPSFLRKTDCSKWKAEQISKKAKIQVYGDSNIHTKMTFAEFSKKWIEAKTSADLAKGTLKKYNDFCRVHFNPEFGHRDLKTIHKSEIQNFQIKLRTMHNAKGTNLIMTGLRSVFKEAVKEEYLIRNPCEFVKNLSVDKRVPSFWTEADIEKFQNYYLDHKYYNLVTFAFNSGMRLGELAGLCWDRVSFEDNLITVSRTRDRVEHKDRSKTNRIRFIPINEKCCVILHKLKEQNINDSKFVFIDKNGQPFKPHHLSRDIRGLQKKAGIVNEIRFHDLRHTYASQYMRSGRSIYTLQRLLGHSSVAMTENYAHHSKEHLQDAVKGFQLGK